MIELRGIGKFFPSNGVTALNDANLTLRGGEILALLGENGTGKSTLMHILAGYFPPTKGSIFIDGKRRHLSAPSAALARGIGMVRQHPGFIRGFKVWEDCILGAESRRKGPASLFLDPGVSRKRVFELSARWEFDLPLDSRAESLTVSQRQKAAVLALLLRDVKWFIFDEPTAVLSPEETSSLLELLRRLRGQGRGIILITHKLEEALAVSDRVTVIRRGATRETVKTEGCSKETLAALISAGEQFPAGQPPSLARNGARGEESVLRVTDGSAPLSGGGEKKPVLEIRNLSMEWPGMPRIRNLSLRVMPGKITGIAGVRDSGLETLERVVTGLLYQGERGPGRYAEFGGMKGSVTLNGRDITGRGIGIFRAAGGAYLGADRLGTNLAPGLPLKESLVIHAFRRERRGIFLDTAALDSWCRKIMDSAGIDRSPSGRADSFSGGMLQRVLLAREFAEGASLVVLAEPGSGLDQNNRARLGEELKGLARNGTAVLLFSTDVMELTSIADEIMTLRNGMLTHAGGEHRAV